MDWLECCEHFSCVALLQKLRLFPQSLLDQNGSHGYPQQRAMTCPFLVHLSREPNTRDQGSSSMEEEGQRSQEGNQHAVPLQYFHSQQHLENSNRLVFPGETLEFGRQLASVHLDTMLISWQKYLTQLCDQIESIFIIILSAASNRTHNSKQLTEEDFYSLM